MIEKKASERGDSIHEWPNDLLVKIIGPLAEGLEEMKDELGLRTMADADLTAPFKGQGIVNGS